MVITILMEIQMDLSKEKDLERVMVIMTKIMKGKYWAINSETERAIEKN